MHRLLPLALALAGCVSQSGDEPDGGFTTAPGIYFVTAAPATGDCQPATVSGPFSRKVEVFVGPSESGLSLTVPSASDGTSFMQPTLAERSWSGSLDVCGARDDVQLVIDLENGSRLDVTRSDSWSNVAAARGACVVPRAACRASVQLTYTLADACPPPQCTVRSAATIASPGALVCVCTSGDGGTL